MKLKSATTSEISAALHEARTGILKSTKTAAALTEEILLRLHELEKAKELIAENPEEDDEHESSGIPAPAGTPGPNYYAPIVANQTEVLTPDMGRDAIWKKIAQAQPYTRFKVRGLLPEIYLGGGKSNAPGWADRGMPINNLEFVADSEDAGIKGLRLGTQTGGVGDNLRFIGLKFYPQLDGDHAPIMAHTNMNEGAHLILMNCDLRAYPGGTAFYGKGFKWGIMTKGMKTTAKNLVTDSSGEHSWYDKNSQGTHIDGLFNRTIFRNGLELGNVRTLYQHTDRKPSATNKGGPPSSGRLVLRNLKASHCCHYALEELGKAQGGSAITIAGHSGEEVIIDSPRILSPYCGGIAVWAEYVKAEGFRGHSMPGTNRLSIIDYFQKGFGNRADIMLSSIGHLLMNGVDPAHVNLNHQIKEGLTQLAEISKITWPDAQ